MPTARLPTRNQRRTLFAAFCVISGLAFMLGQGVAAYQAAILRMDNASLVPQIHEQVSIAYGVTPTPTVRTPKVAAYAPKKRASTTRTAAPVVATQTPAPTADAKGDGHEHGKHDTPSHDKPAHDDHGKFKGNTDAGSPKDSGTSENAAKPAVTVTTDAAGQSLSTTTSDKNNAAHP